MPPDDFSGRDLKVEKRLSSVETTLKLLISAAGVLIPLAITNTVTILGYTIMILWG